MSILPFRLPREKMDQPPPSPPDHNLLSTDRHHLTHQTHGVLNNDDDSDGRPSHVFLFYRRTLVVR
jgi:hypothetical protein